MGCDQRSSDELRCLLQKTANLHEHELNRTGGAEGNYQVFSHAQQRPWLEVRAQRGHVGGGVRHRRVDREEGAGAPDQAADGAEQPEVAIHVRSVSVSSGRMTIPLQSPKWSRPARCGRWYEWSTWPEYAKLPNREKAVIPQAKIMDYLLSVAHPHGRHKAAFFHRFGYIAESWGVLAAALLRHAAEHDVTKVEDSLFGTRYTIEGILVTPDGRMPVIRSVWFIENGEDIPRFVTAYPLGREE